MKPSVAMVRPKHPENIGAVARVMANFGVEELILVQGGVGAESYKLARKADRILDNAKNIESLEYLKHDLIVGTTARRADQYNIRRSYLTPKEFAKIVGDKKGKMAIVLGPEDDGLSREELEQCDVIVSIPSDSGYPTLNISHAAAVILYELSKGKFEEGERAAKREELDVLYNESDKFIEALDVRRKHVFKLLLRRVFGRGLTSREAHGVIGLLKKARRMVSKHL